MPRAAASPAAMMALAIVCAALIYLATADVSDPPLVEATKQGDLARVEALLEAGADPDAADRNRNTALAFAARDDRAEIARRLLESGASVERRDADNATPLILAARNGSFAVARLLLDRGADPDLRDKWARSALDYARRRGDDDPLAVLLAQEQ